MSTNSINNLSSSYVETIIASTFQSAGLSTQNNPSIGSIGTTTPTDNGQLSPFAQVLSTLQQLQQTNPTEYQQVTQQIATNLQSAAQTATSQGNTGAATQLNQLATDFTSASQSGQLPNIQDLAEAIGGGTEAIGGGGHHHHHHHESSDATNGSSSTSNSSSTGIISSTGNQSLSQLLASFQSNSSSLNPLSIILNTLNTAGVLGSSS